MRIFYFFFIIISCNQKDAAKNTVKDKDYSKIHAEAMDYCKTKNMNADYYFLIDLSLHSGINRFFIYDFKTDKILEENLVTHGSCDAFQKNGSKYQTAKFSNKPDSHCSSLGKYKIGKRDYSSWGINVKYWLHGLENTNSKAEDRVVVLHSWKAVSNNEIYPKYSPLSWGCPAVSDAFMKKLDSRLKETAKPVLLWIIE